MSSVGLTYGWCHVAGVYINATLGVSGFHYKEDGSVWLEGLGQTAAYDSRWQLTNTHTNQRISFNTGLMVRLGCPLYLMVGVGYCYHTMTYKATDGDWIKIKGPYYKHHAATYQIGLVANIKGFSLMASYAGYADEKHYPEISIGIGCALNDKKGGKK